MLRGKLYKISRSHIVLFVLGVVFAETALVSCYEILILWHLAGQPAMARGSLQVPNFVGVHETNPKTFCHSELLYKLA